MNNCYDSYIKLLKSIRSLNDVVISDVNIASAEDHNRMCNWTMGGITFAYNISVDLFDIFAALNQIGCHNDNDQRLVVLELILEKFNEDVAYMAVNGDEYDELETDDMTDDQMANITAEVDRITSDVLHAPLPELAVDVNKFCTFVPCSDTVTILEWIDNYDVIVVHGGVVVPNSKAEDITALAKLIEESNK